MLVASVIVYMAATVAEGLYAARLVHGSKDFMVAGRSIPLYMNFACVFATWFGAETVLSVSSRAAHQGLGFVSGDPFGAAACLVLVACLRPHVLPSGTADRWRLLSQTLRKNR